MDAELDRFKSDISLADYAQAEHGYELTKRESSAASKVLKLGGDKIIVTRQQDGHDVYFSVGDDRDCGSIVDFVQRRKPLSLGQVRKELRAWLPSAKRPAIKMPARTPDRPLATPKDHGKALGRWVQMQPYTGSYLSRDRGLDLRIIEAFEVRQDERGNACIAHRDAGSEVVGWEAKNKGFTGYAAGGLRGLAYTRIDSGPVTRLVVTEAALDAMSYAQIQHQPGTAYVSTGGSALSATQRQQLAQLMAPGVPVVLAMDRDDAGERMAQEVAAMAPRSASVVRDVPQGHKDWNEALQARQGAEAARQQAERDNAQRALQAQQHRPAPASQWSRERGG
jgi:hypothetical protein